MKMKSNLVRQGNYSTNSYSQILIYISSGFFGSSFLIISEFTNRILYYG